jgi:hypothetical protein
MYTLRASIQKRLLAVFVFSLCWSIQQSKAGPSDYDLIQIQTTPLFVNLNNISYVFLSGSKLVSFREYGSFQVDNPDAVRDHLQASSHWARVAYPQGEGAGWGFVNLRFALAYSHFDSPDIPDKTPCQGEPGLATFDKDKVKREFGLQ